MLKALAAQLVLAVGLLSLFACNPLSGLVLDDSSWTDEFYIEEGELASTGRNPYFSLEPGSQLVFEGAATRLVITVLDETKTVAGVETRVVEERETKNGRLAEVARNYFAISKRSNTVFYFGEDVDYYKDDKITNHAGTWLAGVQDAKFGIQMLGLPVLKAKYYQEIAPSVAMDRAEIVSTQESVTTPAGKFSNVLKVEETTPLEPNTNEYKYYAPGVGLVQDGSLKLVKYGMAE